MGIGDAGSRILRWAVPVNIGLSRKNSASVIIQLQDQMVEMGRPG